MNLRIISGFLLCFEDVKIIKAIPAMMHEIVMREISKTVLLQDLEDQEMQVRQTHLHFLKVLHPTSAGLQAASSPAAVPPPITTIADFIYMFFLYTSPSRTDGFTMQRIGRFTPIRFRHSQRYRNTFAESASLTCSSLVYHAGLRSDHGPPIRSLHHRQPDTLNLPGHGHYRWRYAKH